MTKSDRKQEYNSGAVLGLQGLTPARKCQEKGPKSRYFDHFLPILWKNHGKIALKSDEKAHFSDKTCPKVRSPFD